jgi:hypothetical protein
MADIQEFIYKGKKVRMRVNQSGAEYIGEFDIEGMNLSPAAAKCPDAKSAKGAFDSCKRKAEELIDAQGPVKEA